MRASRAAFGYVLGLLLLVGFSATLSAASFEEDYAKYQLFVNCEPISIGIKLDSTNAARAGITAIKIRNLLEGRLQTLGVPLDLSAESLAAQVHLGLEDRPVSKGQRNVTQLSIAFWKVMREPFGQRIGYSATWEYVTLMELGLDGFAFYRAISTGLDRFIADFLRNNDFPCE